jgi:hypothetical protein
VEDYLGTPPRLLEETLVHRMLTDGQTPTATDWSQSRSDLDGEEAACAVILSRNATLGGISTYIGRCIRRKIDRKVVNCWNEEAQTEKGTKSTE